MVKLLIFLFIISLILLVLLFIKIDKNRVKGEDEPCCPRPKTITELDLEIELLQSTIDLKLSRIQKENPEKVAKLKTEIARMENEIAEAEKQRAMLTNLK